MPANHLTDPTATQPLVEVMLKKHSLPGQHGFMLIFPEDLSDEEIDKWVAWMGASFFELWAAGGLGGARFAPSREQERHWSWSFSTRGADDEPTLGFLIAAGDLDPGALRVLRNVVEAGMYAMESVVLFLVIEFEPEPATRVDELDFPGAWPKRSFEVEQYEIMSRNFNVEVALDRAYTLLELVPLVCRIAHWLKTVQHGGFGGHPYAPWENGLELNEKPLLISGSSLLIRMQEFYARPDAFDSLLNLLAADEVTQVVRIEQVIVNE